MDPNVTPVWRGLYTALMNEPFDCLPESMKDLISICQLLQEMTSFRTCVQISENQAFGQTFKSVDDGGKLIFHFPRKDLEINGNLIKAQIHEKSNRIELVGFYYCTIRIYVTSLHKRIASILPVEDISILGKLEVVQVYDVSTLVKPGVVPVEDTSILKLLLTVLSELKDELDLSILQFYTQEIPDLERTQTLDKSRFTRLAGILPGLSEGTVENHLNICHTIDFADYIAQIIGIKSKIIHTILGDLDDLNESHFTYNELILKYIDNFEKPEENQDHFEALGFTKSRVNYFLNQWEEDSHFTVVEFINRYLQDLFHYHLLLTDRPFQLTHHPGGLTDTPYSLDAFANTSSTGRKVNCEDTSWIANEKDDKKRTVLTASAREKLLGSREEGFESWFHATSTLSADRIREHGINLRKGNPMKDFSDGSGFYLSECIDAAEDHAKKIGPHTAILRYKIPSSLLQGGIEINHRNSDDMKEWRRIVKFFRSGGIGPPTTDFKPKKIKSLIAEPFIKGPIARNPNWTRANNSDPRWPNVYPDWLQICIASQSLADEVTKCLDFILYIKG